MKYAERLFEHWIDTGRNVYEDIEFDRCEFWCCDISLCDSPQQRTIARRIHLRACVASGARRMGPLVLEDSLIEDLRTPGDLVVSGAVFSHVSLAGKFGRIIVNYAPDYPLNDQQIAAFRAANDDYYRSVDWALDISRARFRDGNIRLPHRLVRRDPNTQIVVPSERLIDGRWREMDLSASPGLEMQLKWIANGEREFELIIANTVGSAQCKKDLALFALLRREGIALSD